MPVVRSVTTVTLSPAGRPAVSCGSASLIWSTVVMTLAPGWRWTLSTMAGDRPAGAACVAARSYQAPSRLFSAPLDDLGHVLQPDRRAVRVGDDLVGVVGGRSTSWSLALIA